MIADNVQSSRVFEEELAGLGFQLKERPWYDDPFQVVAELCHNKRVATDLGGYGCSPVAARGRRPARPAAPADRARAAAAARAGPHPDPGRRGHLPQLRPGRARGRRRRPPGSPPDPRGGRPGRPAGRQRRPPGPVSPADLQGVARSCSGRRSPSPAAGTGSAPRSPARSPSARSTPSSGADHSLATMVDATCIFFSRPGEPSPRSSAGPSGSTRSSTIRTNGRSTTRGASIGYSPREVLLAPDSNLVLEPDMALPGAPASARPAPKTPSSSTPAATRSSPRRRTGPRSRSPSRATSSPGRAVLER